MLDITVIILTWNEEIHIRRCLENVNQFAARVIVVDCFSTDGTAGIAREIGAEVVEHKWPGNQADQFNWALDTLEIGTGWVLRLDADEYLQPDLVEELREKLPQMPEDVAGLSLSRARAFQGKILRHGITGDVRIVRIFRTGKARYERRIMDEHLSVPEGRIVEMKHRFVDDNRMIIGEFIRKHEDYASREAALLLDARYHLTGAGCKAPDHGRAVEKKRERKERYSRMPLFWRAFAYFIYRYIIRLGFLDGKEGFLWDFLQGWWYRTLVDAKVYEVQKACGSDREKILSYLSDKYGIDLSSRG